MICPRCKREATGWPLRRADLCSPRDWVNCIRNPEAIITKERERQEKEQGT